jgi:3-phosphoshikimate 1-carboxyvinyltransferase
MKPIAKIAGEIFLPGSKSLSNRALLLASLAHGSTAISNLLAADDIRHMLGALQRLGVRYELSPDRTQCTITGNNGPFVAAEPLEFHLGNAGTAMRPLCAALCLGRGTFTLTGEPRMQERPIGDLVQALRAAGATISYLQADGYPPVKIEAAGLHGGEISVRGAISSQFLSSLLMAAPLFSSESIISVEGELVSKPYIDLTIDMIAKFGVTVEREGARRFFVGGGQTYQAPGALAIEGDASAASYFFAAAAIKGSVRVHGLNRDSKQGDILFLDVLEKMGARVIRAENFVEVHQGELRGIDIDANQLPDAAMTLATTALFARGRTVIRNISNWRVKETDRLAAMAAELRKTGARVTEGADFLEIDPPAAIEHATIDTYEDHRIAMCFALLALAESSVTINNPGCVSKTFPDFFPRLSSISLPPAGEAVRHV